MLKAGTKDSKRSLNLTKRNYQPQKIFVENLKSANSIEHLETDVSDYFSHFGHVIDVKVLRNGGLTRQPAALRLHHLLRRGAGAGSALAAARVPGADRGLTSW